MSIVSLVHLVVFFSTFDIIIVSLIFFPPPRYNIVELQLVVVNVCESDGPATVCVQLRTDTEREATATVQTSDLSALSESCMHARIVRFACYRYDSFSKSIFCVIAHDI